MTQKDIALYYEQLTRGEKGRFTAFISLRLGGSPHSWQHRLLCVCCQKYGYSPHVTSHHQGTVQYH